VAKNKFELADVIRRFGTKLVTHQKLSPQQTKALFNILQCRTASLGGHEEECDCCGEIRYSYNSCGDRHCPKCQAAKQALWVEKLTKTTLPVKHYHIIFTIPHCLNKICLWNDAMFYKLFFSAAWRTLHSFGYTHYGVESGALAVLHSWGQNLALHPHIHCIVPAAGYSIKGEWKHIGKSGRYLYPVHQLSDTFKGKFLDSLKRQLKKQNMSFVFDSLIQQAYKKKWVVFSEESLTKADHVIKYLGQYTHRVAITNQRILNITDTHVTFIAKDYRNKAHSDSYRKKPATLEGVEFLKRFCLHILPKRFVKVRRFGIYNPTTKRNLNLKFVEEANKINPKPDGQNKKETAQEILKRITGFDAYQCPFCKKGKMQKIRELPRIRSPNTHLPSLLLSFLL